MCQIVKWRTIKKFQSRKRWACGENFQKVDRGIMLQRILPLESLKSGINVNHREHFSHFPKYLEHILFCGCADTGSCLFLKDFVDLKNLYPGWKQRLPHSRGLAGFFIQLFKSLQTIFLNSPRPCVKGPIVYLKTCSPRPNFLLPFSSLYLMI